VQVLNAAGCALVGGHSGEGPELSLGFAINGLVDLDAQGQPLHLMRKTGALAGDALLLTKPLGTGTLFAAHALGRARGRWVEAALDSMAQSSQGAAQTLAQFGAHACTDVTGFGLLGHLVEMLQSPGVFAGAGRRAGVSAGRYFQFLAQQQCPAKPGDCCWGRQRSGPGFRSQPAPRTAV